ncbi:hypothetical protein [Leifsonia sp. PS1209]|uniref:hypothetical protein n=1 Tax=Leifsonia sp. PS1209 TaxID=2724914 RepID=UPI001442AE14|nr:hypothetical protein [Leifsonia sp. PS1209]QJA00076.1 hypothetical protein HF024_17255 [Leifsonia sp. PS1209]
MLVFVIIACEILFWVFLLGGLLARYALRRRRLGSVLLVLVPVADLVLLAATVADLAGGATAEWAHGLAAAYLGFSVAFGHGIISRMDARFAHRYDGAPAPERIPKGGRRRVLHEWKVFGQTVIAWAIACALLLAAILVVGDEARTAALSAWLGTLTLILGIAAIWPISYTIWPGSDGQKRTGQPAR